MTAAKTLPTEAELRAMPAGREMDALVAEIVCGWSEVRHRHYEIGCPAPLVELDGINPITGRLEDVPEYSCSWVAAGPLLESCPYRWEIGYDPGGWGKVTIFVAKPDGDESVDPFIRCSAKFLRPGDLCRAICVARLLAAMEGKK